MRLNKQKMKKLFTMFSVCFVFVVQNNCSSSSDGGSDPVDPPPVVTDPATNEVDFYMTNGGGTSKLAKQNTVLAFGTVANNNPTIEIDPDVTYQSIDGFGYTLTGGSAQVINDLSAAKKQELLQDLFGAGGIGISYLRLSIGASDLNAAPYTYNDLPVGETDMDLSNFSLAPDAELIDLLQEILQINPNIKFMSAPWSAPVWMKDNGSFINGSLQPQYYSVYADYFVKYVQGMQAEGITIHAVTPQNEPLNPYNNPSLVMQANDQATFIKNHLGPAFASAGITTKIVIYDHNADVPSYPLSILNDPAANQYVDGSAWHLYAGDISALSVVHNAHPAKNIYFTEQWTSGSGSFAGDLRWHVKNVLIGSTRNWSKIALEWNLASDPNFEPHTPGGCSECKGAITVTSSGSYTKNVAYYIIAHASKFVPAGSVRIASNISGNLHNVAFKRPDGKTVLVVLNDGTSQTVFNIKVNGKWTASTLEAGAVGTYIW
ncbi:MAG TPA: glycoside hydrolase family 30 beta sandwich domain-containing protein [Flavobacterium sp.]|jgi:glucosylceramidase